MVATKLTVCECACVCCQDRRAPVKLGLAAVYPTGEVEPRALDRVLTPTERRILTLAAMAHPGPFDARPALDSYWPEGGESNRHTSRIHVTRLRPKIRPYGLALICHFGAARYHLEETEAR